MTYSYNNSILGDYLTPSGTNLIVENHIIISSGSINSAVIGNTIPSSGYFTNLFSSGIPVSISGHSHTSNDIIDFNSAVSGLIPPSNFTSLSGVSGILVINSGTNYYVSLSDPTVQLVDITDLSSDARTFLLTPSSDNLITLITDETGSGLLVFNTSPAFSGIPTVPTAPSGTNSTQIANTAFVRTEISNLVDSAPSTLDTLNELAAALGDDPNFATTITNTLASKANLSGAIFTGSVTIPSGTANFNSLSVNGTSVSISGHTHTSSNITDFNSSVSGLLPSISGSGYVSSSFNNNIYTISVSGLQPSGNYSTVGHTHTSVNITDFDTAVSGLIPVKDIVAGTDINISSTSGIYTINSSNTISSDTLEPDGFVNRTDSTISFDDSSREFSIAPKSPATSYSIYNNGVKVVKNTTETTTLPDTTALYFIHFDKSTNNLSYKTTGFNFDTDIPIAQVYYNADDNKAVYFGEERHGIRMDASTHRYLHNVFGTQYVNGLSISNYSTSGNGSSNSDATIAIGDGLIYDEDIEANITHSNTPNDPFEQILNPIAQIPVYYKVGNNGAWTDTTANDYPVKTDTTIQYNLNSAGTWSTSNSSNPTNDRYIAYWICATTQENAPIISIMGQRIDSSLEQATSNNSWGGLNLTGLPIVELRPLYRLIYDTKSTFSNTPKGFLVDVLDIRSHIDTVTGLTQNDHGNLYGLADDDHYQYVHIDNARTIDAVHTFTNGLNASGLINASSGNFTSLTINGTGVSLFGHTHTASNITDFNSSVSGLLPSVSGSGYATTSFANNIYTVSVTGLQPSGNYSTVGHTHTASNITDFNSSVSGLLPIKDISAGSGIGIASLSGNYTISVTGTFGLTSEEVDDRVSQLLVAGSGINLNYIDSSNQLIITSSAASPVSIRGSEQITSNKTIFNIPETYIIGQLDVYFNGVKLLSGIDYTATDGSSFTLTQTATSGDIIEWLGLSGYGSYLPYALEQFDDRMSELLVAGTGIHLSYDDPNNNLTISTTGVSLTGHTHSVIIQHSLASDLNALASTGINYIYVFNNGSEGYSLVLPTAVNNQSIYILKNNTNGTVYIKTSNSETVDNYSPTPSPSGTVIGLNIKYSSITLISDNSGWLII